MEMHGSEQDIRVVKALGIQRMKKYLSQMGNHAGRAIKLYKWDAEISAALWNLVALVEVVLRNKICEQSEIWSVQNTPRSNPDWIMQPRLNVQEPLSKVSASISDPALNKAVKAKEIRDEGAGLTRGDHPRKGQPITKDDVISQVTLTQWKEYFSTGNQPRHQMGPTIRTGQHQNELHARLFNKAACPIYDHFDEAVERRRVAVG